jgi:hypothetical protein
LKKVMQTKMPLELYLVLREFASIQNLDISP